MSQGSDSDAIRSLKMLVSELGVLRLVRSLVLYESPGGEIVSCEFDDENCSMLIRENWGYEDPEQLHHLPGHRLAVALERWVHDTISERAQMALETRSLAVKFLPQIIDTFGCKWERHDADLDQRAHELHEIFISTETFSSTASKDPVARTFYRVFLDDLTDLLPKLSHAEPWSARSQEIIPHVQKGSVMEVELCTNIHPMHTETHIAPDVFCDRLFDHLCEVIAYYRALADEARQVLDTTLPQLIEKMKRRGVW